MVFRFWLQVGSLSWCWCFRVGCCIHLCSDLIRSRCTLKGVRRMELSASIMWGCCMDCGDWELWNWERSSILCQDHRDCNVSGHTILTCTLTVRAFHYPHYLTSHCHNSYWFGTRFIQYMSNIHPVYHTKPNQTKPVIQINQPTRCKNFSSLLLDVYVQLNMFWASSRLSSGAQQLQ
jgi:hypothetical protein